MKHARKQSDKALRVEGRQTIETAAALLVDLRQLFAREANPVIDLSTLEDCSMATLQLLCSAASTAASAGSDLTIAAIHPLLVPSIRVLGLHHATPFQSLIADL